MASGGGGSSFISGMTGCVAIDPTSISESRAQDSATGTEKTSLNYNTSLFGASPTWQNGAEIIFTNTSMTAGNRTGDGYATIIYIGQ